LSIKITATINRKRSALENRIREKRARMKKKKKKKKKTRQRNKSIILCGFHDEK
jgi:hypothetical protein